MLKVLQDPEGGVTVGFTEEVTFDWALNGP